MAVGTRTTVNDPIQFFGIDPSKLSSRQRGVLASMVGQSPEKITPYLIQQGINTKAAGAPAGPVGSPIVPDLGVITGGGTNTGTGGSITGGNVVTNANNPLALQTVRDSFRDSASVGTSNTNTSGTSVTNTTNAPQSALTALDNVLAQLSKGGTANQLAIQANRSTEIDRNRATQGGFTRETARADAQGLIDKAIQDSLKAAAPKITRYSEGSGASRSSQAALLTQDAAIRGATEGAALGANLSTAYGQLSNQLAGTLELLTRQDPNDPVNTLIQAIQSSKGMVQNTTQTTNQNQVQNTTNRQQDVSRENIYGQPPSAQQNTQDLLNQVLAQLQKPAGGAAVPTLDTGEYDTGVGNLKPTTPGTGSGYVVADQMPDTAAGNSSWNAFDQEDADFGNIWANGG